ncbi:S-adenosylmethionine uptake transporter [Roseibium marinum]|uniref:S-adenosylmethionine uptake transporter n=2 Tax=Roseibium marinum TaxID=281252 RepID=A0A2S3UWP9_9HYPH|nr:S-adenosylmethionine uptake transporter [Roseibium marinum]
MALNIWALTIVKWLGLGYPVAQLVFLRASIGFLLLLPSAWRWRDRFLHVHQLPLHVLRVALSALALSVSFFALSRLPFALVTAIGFTRPFVMMVMAAVFLSETIGPRRWIAAGIAFLGVVIAVDPGLVSFTWGLPAMGAAVFFGSAAVIVMRRLVSVPNIVLMVFYTAGLAILTAPFAIVAWVDIPANHLAPLLGIGLFSQGAQYCFLNAHRRADAGYLAILGYLSLILTTVVGYLVFDEIPSLRFGLGAVLIVGAALWITRAARSSRVSRWTDRFDTKEK